ALIIPLPESSTPYASFLKSSEYLVSIIYSELTCTWINFEDSSFPGSSHHIVPFSYVQGYGRQISCFQKRIKSFFLVGVSIRYSIYTYFEYNILLIRRRHLC